MGSKIVEVLECALQLLTPETWAQHELGYDVDGDPIFEPESVTEAEYFKANATTFCSIGALNKCDEFPAGEGIDKQAPFIMPLEKVARRRLRAEGLMWTITKAEDILSGAVAEYQDEAGRTLDEVQSMFREAIEEVKNAAMS